MSENVAAHAAFHLSNFVMKILYAGVEEDLDIHSWVGRICCQGVHGSASRHACSTLTDAVQSAGTHWHVLLDMPCLF